MGGTVHSLTLGNVSGAFGSDPNSFEYHSGRVGGAALGLGVAIGTGGAAYEAGGAILAANPTAYSLVAAAAPVAYNIGNAITGETPAASIEQQLYHYTDSAGAAGIRAAGNTLLPGPASGGAVWATTITPEKMFGPLGGLYKTAIGGGVNFAYGGPWYTLGIKYTGTTQFTRYFEVANPSQFSPAWPIKALMGQFSAQGAASVK